MTPQRQPCFDLAPRAWLIVGLLWVAAFLNYLDRNMILTMRLSVKEAIPMTEAQFGLLTSVFLWVYAGLSPFAGYLADRFSRSRVIGSLFRCGSFALMLAVWGLLGLAGWALAGWLPTYFGERFQLTQGTAGFSATGYLSAAIFIGLLSGGAWSARWSRTNPRARILVPIIGQCIAAPGVFLAAYTHSFPLAVIGVMIHGITRSFTDSNMMPILCLVADPRYRTTGFGVLNLAACMVGGLAIYAGGALRDAKVDVSLVFQCAAAGLALCAVLFAFVKPFAGNTEQ